MFSPLHLWGRAWVLGYYLTYIVVKLLRLESLTLPTLWALTPQFSQKRIAHLPQYNTVIRLIPLLISLSGEVFIGIEGTRSQELSRT
jgi:hypothetical protein